MSRTYYPSDEYDSYELEQKREKRRRRLLKRLWSDDDDDAPPAAPVAHQLPKTPPLGAAQAA